MDFVDGITVCSDCGSPLVDKEQYFAEKAEKEKKEREEELRKIEEAEEQLNGVMKGANGMKSPEIYEKKSEKYEDLLSSASAFRIVGIILAVFALATWLNLLHLPMSGGSGIIFRLTLTVLAVLSLFISWKTGREAVTVKSQIKEENEATKQLTQWFLDNYTAEQIDAEISREESSGLRPEELALKRMNYIQDAFITNHDLANQGYVDLLSEEVYPKLFEKDKTDGEEVDMEAVNTEAEDTEEKKDI